MENDFFSEYLRYNSGGEVPIVHHRWSAITCIAALLERQTWIIHGHNNIYPNIYCMLMGISGTRKTTAIMRGKRLLEATGYSTFSAQRTSKEKYLADLSMQASAGDLDDDILERNIFGSALGVNEITPNFIVAEEANDFFGINNLEFLSMLGSMWDWEGQYENRLKTGKSDFIPNPTITILAGNTPTNFAIAFPPAIFGQGFFSRILLIHGEPTGNKVTWPTRPSAGAKELIIKSFKEMKYSSTGEKILTKEAQELLDLIYKRDNKLTDPRFDSYYSRRLTHLLKLCIVVSTSRYSNSIDADTVVQANTYLSYSESLMPKALGQFGKAKDSDVSHKVSVLIHNSNRPITMLEIWENVATDLKKLSDLGEIIRNLLAAKKIQSTSMGFLPVRKAMNIDEEIQLGLVNYEKYLTTEELGVKI